MSNEASEHVQPVEGAAEPSPHQRSGDQRQPERKERDIERGDGREAVGIGGGDDDTVIERTDHVQPVEGDVLDDADIDAALAASSPH